MKKLACTLFAALVSFALSAADLSVGPGDVRIVQSPDGGYHLYVRKKPGIASVLLTETTRDPNLRADNYAYRAPDWNPVNGDEKRLLDGTFIPPEKKLWSLIDSTPEAVPGFGEAFHVWIPYLIQYGYTWSRHGEVQVLDGTYLNIRAFEKPWADYSGEFRDNPFRLRVTQKALPAASPSGVKYMDGTVAAFSDLAGRTGGKTLYAKGPDDLVPMVREALLPATARALDLVFVIDATESMQDDIGKLRELVEPELAAVLPGYPAWRVALVLYKDYFEDFLVKQACPFTTDLAKFRAALDGFRVQGGRDIPEAVYEALDGALALPWSPGTDRKIILIGDAPPHPKPRGRVTKDIVDSAAAEKGVQMNVIILPHGEAY